MKCFCMCILVFCMSITCESFGVLNLFSSNKQLVLTDQKSNFQDAQKYCKDLGGFLPTDDEVKAQTSQSNQSGDYWVSWQIKTDVSGSTHKYLGRKTDAKAWSMHHECWTVCCVHKGTVDGKGFQFFKTNCDAKLSVMCAFDTVYQAQVGRRFIAITEFNKNISDSIDRMDRKIDDVKLETISNITNELLQVIHTQMQDAKAHFNDKLTDLKNNLNEEKDEIRKLTTKLQNSSLLLHLDNLKAENDDSVSETNADVEDTTNEHAHLVHTQYGLIDNVHETVNKTIAYWAQNASRETADKHQLQNERLNNTLDNFKAQGMQLNKTVGHLSQEIEKISQNLTKIVEAIQNLTNIQVQDEPITDLKDANRIHEMMIYGIISFLAFSSILFILLKVVCVSCKRKKVKKEHSMKFSASQEQVELVVDVKEAETEKSRNSLTRSDKSYQSNGMVHGYFDNNIYEEPFIQKDLLEEIYATHEEMTELKNRKQVSHRRRTRSS